MTLVTISISTDRMSKRLFDGEHKINRWISTFLSSWARTSGISDPSETVLDRVSRTNCVSFNHAFTESNQFVVVVVVVVHSDHTAGSHKKKKKNFKSGLLGLYSSRNTIASVWVWDELVHKTTQNMRPGRLNSTVHTNPSGDVWVKRGGLRGNSWGCCGAWST